MPHTLSLSSYLFSFCFPWRIVSPCPQCCSDFSRVPGSEKPGNLQPIKISSPSRSLFSSLRSAVNFKTFSTDIKQDGGSIANNAITQVAESCLFLVGIYIILRLSANEKSRPTNHYFQEDGDRVLLGRNSERRELKAEAEGYAWTSGETKLGGILR